MASIIIPEDMDSGDEYVWMLQKEEYEKGFLVHSSRNMHNSSNNANRHLQSQRYLNGNSRFEEQHEYDDNPQRPTRRTNGRNQHQIRNDELFAKKVQEDLDRELAYKIENEDLKRNRTNSFDRGNLVGFNGNEHGFDDSQCTITSTSPTPAYRRFSSDHGRSIYSSNATRPHFYSNNEQPDELINDFMLNVNSIFNQRVDSTRTHSSMRNLNSFILPTRYDNRRFNGFNTNRDFTPEDYDALLALDENSKSKICLSKSELDGLRPYEYIIPTSNSASEDSKTCTICYDDFKSKEKVIALGCFHKFHDKCILEWLKQSRNCPLCKKDAITVN